MQPDLIQAGEVTRRVRTGQPIDTALATEQDEFFLVHQVLGDRRHTLSFEPINVDGFKGLQIM